MNNNNIFWNAFETHSARLRLGQEIYDQRQNGSLNQTGLAKAAKTTQRVVSNIENGEMNVGFDLLFRLIKCLSFTSENLSRVFGVPQQISMYVVTPESVGTQVAWRGQAFPKVSTYESKTYNTQQVMTAQFVS